MTTDLYLGLDVGTTHTKGVLLDPAAGATVALARRPTPTYSPAPDRHEHHADALWGAVADCIRDLVDRQPEGSRIAGVAAASMGEAGTLFDAEGAPLCPIIAWHDHRTLPQRNAWDELVSPYDLFRIAGQHITHIFSACKMAWIRENWPDAWRRATRWSCVHDMVVWRLSGAHATDHTIASRTMLLDQKRGDWSDTLLRLGDIPRDLLPAPYPSGTAVGAVTQEAAKATGLPMGIPVVTGGHDHLCAALACGGFEDDDLMDSAGTAETLLWVTPEHTPSRELFEMGYAHYRHTAKGKFVIQGGLDTSGAYLVWMARMMGLSGEDAVGELLAMAEQAAPGAGGIVATPNLLGRGTPHRDPRARATLSGLAQEQTRADLGRAAVEALARWVADNITALRGLLGRPPGRILATGGANRSPLLCQCKADLTRLPVTTPQLDEGAAIGAALLAAVGAGRFGSIQQAYRSLELPSTTWVPTS